MVPNRRIHRRLICDIQTDIFPYTRETKIGEGRVIDIALGGLQIRCKTDLHHSVPYRLQLFWNDQWLPMDSRVAREVGRDPQDPEYRVYGMVFNASSSQEFRLRPLLQELLSGAA